MHTFRTHISELSLLFAAIIWGSTYFLVKDLVMVISPFPLTGYRFLLASVLMLFVVVLKKKNLFDHPKENFVLGFLLFLPFVLQTIGQQYTLASNSAFISSLDILLVPIFAFLLTKKAISKTIFFAVLLATAGLYMITGGIQEMNRGDLITVLSAVGYALYIVFTNYWMKKGLDPISSTFQQLLFTAVFCFLSMLVFQIPFPGLPSGTILPFLYLSIFSSFLAYLLHMLAQPFVSPIKVTLTYTLTPVFAMIFALILGGEVFSWYRVLGGILIITALIVSSSRND